MVQLIFCDCDCLFLDSILSEDQKSVDASTSTNIHQPGYNKNTGRKFEKNNGNTVDDVSLD